MTGQAKNTLQIFKEKHNFIDVMPGIFTPGSFLFSEFQIFHYKKNCSNNKSHYI